MAFRISIENMKHMHEYFPQHLRKRKRRIKLDEYREEGKQKELNMENPELLLLLFKKIGNARMGEGD